MKDRKPVTREQLEAKLAEVGNKARSILKERGTTDAQIDAEIAKGGKPKRPRDPNQLAKSIVDPITSQTSPADQTVKKDQPPDNSSNRAKRSR